LQENDSKTLIKKVICLLDNYYCNSSNQTKAEQALKEIEFTDSIQSILEYANKRILRNFRYQLLMIDHEDDDSFRLFPIEGVHSGGRY